MAYDRIPGVDENYRFPPEVEGGVRASMLSESTESSGYVSRANKLMRTNDGGHILFGDPFSRAHAAHKGYVDTRVPVNLPITEDNSVGKRIFIGDTMVYGDTGWRYIDESSLTNGWGFSSVKNLRIRRVNEEVVFLVPGLSLTGVDATSDGFYTVPLGFQISSGGNYGAVGSLYDGEDVALIRRDFHELRAKARGQLTGTLTWYTSSLWPTSLPGTPA